ncbi:MAG: hypothetical protein IKW85_02250 [Muribaculaceae bacterium]|nr:hypothetical protein [Muribaculaceae bacterium]
MLTKIEMEYMDAVIYIAKRMRSHDIDWEQRRYEIAKDIMANKCLEEVAEAAGMSFDVNGKERAYAALAVKWADALVDELKKRV